MKSINVACLMSHDTGIVRHYYRPTEDDILNEYLKAIDSLTINEENWLQTRVKELTEKNRDTEYVISAKLLENDEEIKDIKEQLRAIFSTINSSSQSGKIEIARKLVQDELYKPS